MNMIEQIKADRGAGTPGGMTISTARMTISGSIYKVLNPDDFPLAFVPAWDAPEDGEVDGTDEALANARRIARVPDMEAALIAAYDLATAYALYESRANADDPADWAAMDNALAVFRAAIGAE